MSFCGSGFVRFDEYM